MKAKTSTTLELVEETYAKEHSFDISTTPRFLQSRGRALWEAVTDEYDLTSTQLVALAEACHQSDELEKVTAALASRNVLWFELGEPDEDTGDMQIIINNLLTLRDSKAAKLNLALEKIGVLGKAVRKTKDESSAATVMKMLQGAK